MCHLTRISFFFRLFNGEEWVSEWERVSEWEVNNTKAEMSLESISNSFEWN